MIFVDSNVFIYAVGRSHPLKKEAQQFFLQSSKESLNLVTSAEVMQELLHVYLPVHRNETLDAALELALGVHQIVPVTAEAVMYARHLADKHPELTARDLLHLSTCRLHKINRLQTFDILLQKAFHK